MNKPMTPEHAAELKEKINTRGWKLSIKREELTSITDAYIALAKEVSDKETMEWSDAFEADCCENSEIVEQAETIKAQQQEIDAYKDIIKAVAHIGIDWGYGKYELEQKHIDAARKIYEADTALQNPTLTPPKEAAEKREGDSE